MAAGVAMEKKHTFGLLAIVALLSTVLFRAPSTQPARTDPSAEAKEKTPRAAVRREVEEESDALQLLGESLGLDVSPDGVRRRALRNVRAMMKGNQDEDFTDEVTFLSTILRQPVEDPALETARSEVREFADSRKSRLEPGGVRPPGTESPSLAAVESFLTQIAAADLERLVTSNVKRELLKQVAARNRIRVRFVIATLPDPVDSYTGWQFDPLLDAISQAVSASEYTLDRFHFPDLDLDPDGDREPRGRAHEDRPTLIIFRKRADDRNERLVLQVVYETPTAGVHTRAFGRAIRLAARWNDARPDPCGADEPERNCIRILGPTFSGTADSIARGLEMARTALGVQPVWIVSGSATDPSNEKTFVDVGPNTRYQVTVQPDNLLVDVLLEHIAHAGWSDSMAVLFEGNTQYGRQILEHVRGSAEFSLFRQVPFPMNISRLRTNARSEQPDINRQLGLPSRFRELSMEQQGTPSDQIPALFPTTSASYLELAVADMLQSLERDGVRTVALMATDPRDRLYLAQQVARYAPNLSIAVAESDALYAHPDYASYLRGALVASTYPLFVGNQRWSGGAAGAVERRQFANGSAQGIYNAALALLNYDQAGQPMAEHGRVPSLVEYGAPHPGKPCALECRPPVWISVVGRTGLWPIRAYLPGPPSSTVFAVSVPQPVARTAGDAPMVFPSLPFTGLCVALAVLAAVCWTAIVLRTRDSDVRSLLMNRGTRSSVMWGLASVMAIAASLAAVSIGRARVEPTVSTVAIAIVTGLSILVLADAARRLLTHQPSSLGGQSPWLQRVIEWRTVLACLMVWGVGNLFVYAWSTAAATPEEVIGHVTRSTTLDSGVSPLLPVALLLGGVCLWAFAEFRRARTPAAALTDPAVHELIGFGVHGGTNGMSGGWTWFNRSVIAVPAKLQIVALVAVGATCVAFDPFFRPLVSVEGPQFGRFVTATILVLQVTTCLTLVQFLYLWRALRQLLDRLASHPWADAYQRVPQELFPASLVPRIPRLIDLYALVARSTQQVALVAPMGMGVPRAGLEGGDLERVYEDELRADSNIFWSQSATWSALLGAVRRRCRGAAAGVALPEGLDQDAIWNALARDHGSRESNDAVTPVQDLVAISMAFVIRDAVARLWQNLTFVTGSAVLVFLSHTLFRFQPHRHLEALGWTYIAILFTAVVMVLVQMKRNEIISRLGSATASERRTWDGAFLLKLAMFAVIPLLTLFAAQFPDLGGVILRWAEPVQKALP